MTQKEIGAKSATGSPMIKFSIVISTYGRIKYFPELVASFRDQLHEDMEVIVVEGKNREDYERLLNEKSLKDIGARIFFLPRCSLSASRNFGASKASGEWLVFSDDDDVFAPGKLAKFREEIRPDRLVYHSDFFIFDENGRREGSGLRLTVDQKKKTGRILLFVSNFVSGGSAFMIHSSIAKTFPFDEALKGQEDLDFWRRLTLNNIPLHFIDEKLTGYRSHRERMGQSYLRSYLDELILLKKYVCFNFFLTLMVGLYAVKLALKSILTLSRIIRKTAI